MDYDHGESRFEASLADERTRQRGSELLAQGRRLECLEQQCRDMALQYTFLKDLVSEHGKCLTQVFETLKVLK